MANRKQNSRALIGTLAVAGTATLLAFPGVASAAVTSSVAGGVLTASSDGADPITITCVGGQVKVNGANPAPATNCGAITLIAVNGGPGANTIDLSGVTTALFGAVASTTVDAGDLNDTIIGSEHSDTIIWNPGDDDDINEGGAGADTIQVNGGNGGEQFTVKPSATPGRVRFDRTGPTPPGPFNLDIGTAERLDLNANGGDDTLVSDAGLDALGFALDIEGGEGNDDLDGGDGADLIAGGAGNDRITGDDNPVGTRDNSVGGDGDDTMVWNGGDDDDTNEGGAGNDTVTVNGAPVDETFTIKPSATAGRVLFDRLATPGPGPFNIDIGTSESLHLLAGAGNDRIRGAKGVDGRIRTILDAGDGDDRIRGTDAIDAISAGTGDDIVNSIDSSEDTVSCDQGIDLALVDRRDFLRQCELVIGGSPRVAIQGKPQLDGGRVALRLKCVASEKCKSVVRLKRNGKPLGSDRATLKRGKGKDIEIVLNERGRRVLSDGDRVKVQVLSKDGRGNGWRFTKKLRLG